MQHHLDPFPTLTTLNSNSGHPQLAMCEHLHQPCFSCHSWLPTCKDIYLLRSGYSSLTFSLWKEPGRHQAGTSPSVWKCVESPLVAPRTLCPRF